ncbi:hypothetical protein AtNW77_Chr3g0205741 [Arabidopsis thaliana]|uniref:Uncharacterized protein n=4 Tax=Arabidopsis TaxID=3701 RepID=A0A654FFJ3_ARATH|nr:unknown [Arabidopsis thaliana]KAG7628031.1 hypothetical protein ISN45_At03g043240 [Arabidopsis thaliana x Arabidopsis arenosa]KAG7633946.1 hypothetical protein ISN44_As03g042160 [Arabidopsis suecica]CAA0385543.1 unnamed protein product [Arabidopsis thaliana]VYS59990.1 unnamed protein product [Arabidopsis thaliana]
MLLLSPISASLPPSFHRGNLIRRSIKPLGRVVAKAKDNTDTGGFLETAAIAGGLVSTPVIGWSLYTLKTTGCGLPPGPAGLIGALEGVSYLVVVGIVGWSLYTKTKTGSGLPNGPFGLLGAVEGLSYLSVLAILVVFGIQFLDNGSVPGPLPSDQCFG